jgi:two-component sensor histidine kinase
MPDAQATSRAFPAELSSVAAARRFVRAALDGLPDDRRDGLTLVVSELATNALLHAATGFEVTVRWNGSVRIDVSDGSPTMPVRRPATPREVTGRGLQLVEELCSRWGADARDGGKSVWCEFDLVWSG